MRIHANWQDELDRIAAELDSADESVRERAACRLIDIYTSRREYWRNVASAEARKRRLGTGLIIGAACTMPFILAASPFSMALSIFGCFGVLLALAVAVIIATMGLVLVWPVSAVAMTRPDRCRRCEYQLIGLAPLHPLESATRVKISPRICPECACPWPRFPPPIPE